MLEEVDPVVHWIGRQECEALRTSGDCEAVTSSLSLRHTHTLDFAFHSAKVRSDHLSISTSSPTRHRSKHALPCNCVISITSRPYPSLRTPVPSLRGVHALPRLALHIESQRSG